MNDKRSGSTTAMIITMLLASLVMSCDTGSGATTPAPPCTPACSLGFTCVAGVCVDETTIADDTAQGQDDTTTQADTIDPTCTPDCGGKECGSDGCGGSCGTCQTGESCTASGVCEAGAVDPCVGVTCSGHGTCVDVNGQAECQCETKWTGDDCSDCAPGYTKDGSNCVIGVEEMPYDGLMWQWFGGVDGIPSEQKELYWEEAKSLCSNLTWAGYDDWHLPTIDEMKSTLGTTCKDKLENDCEVNDGCLSTTCHDDDDCRITDFDCWWKSGMDWGLPCTNYWSSSEVSNNSSKAWQLSYYWCSIDDRGKTSYKNVAWCVRDI